MHYLPNQVASDKTKLSPRARELATQIERVIRDFQRSYPDTPPGDVEQALSALSGVPSRAPASRKALAMAVAAGVAALLGAVVFASESGDGGFALPSDAMMWVVGALIVGLAVAFVAARQR